MKLRHLLFVSMALISVTFVGLAQTEFNYTGEVQTYQVPAGVTAVELELWGAQGGGSEGSPSQDDGGLGGYATGLLTVTPGQILNLYVGGKPGQVGGVGSPGGFNGGGASGQYGGAGGGASDIRIGGTTLLDRVVVAGGGGGGNTGNPDSGTGGNGGGLVGGDGIALASFPNGTGGTQVAGGFGSGNNGGLGQFAEDGSLGLGGSGVAAGDPNHVAGGGGGYYGGGAAYAAGAGGGSSYIDDLAVGSTSHAARIGHGMIKITPTRVFSYTGDVQTYQIPENYRAVRLNVWGAQGGGSEGFPSQDDGGLGGYATGLLAVTPGEIFDVYVGGKPGQVGGVGSPGGYNGGGASGQYGGAGGGASDVRPNGGDLFDRLIVAGGGGGGNTGNPDQGTGGPGGGLVGGHGIDLQSSLRGLGGSQISGGSGTGDTTFGWFAEDGVFGTGGSGTSAGDPTHVAGGGGGYYGGGAAYTGGGGGGSSFIDGLLSENTSSAAVRTGHGLVQITLVAGFTYSGAVQTYTVPENITTVRLEAWGAQGGDANILELPNQYDGGLGGYATGLLSVTPGQILDIYVGGKPARFNRYSEYSLGGFNGGGDGGKSTGGGGGGASDVRLQYGDLFDRLIVAGGGGGGFPYNGMVSGGVGGGLSGGNGVVYSIYTAGLGGTQETGGLGSGIASNGSFATDGEFGVGGSAFSAPYGMAGGGGGYYGGGAAYRSGAGGGSSYIAGLSDASTTTGVKESSGKVLITATDIIMLSGFE